MNCLINLELIFFFAKIETFSAFLVTYMIETEAIFENCRSFRETKRNKI